MTIATGEQEWQAYLIGWNQGYCAPAMARRRSLGTITQAKSQLLSLPTFAEQPQTSDGMPVKRSPTSKAKSTNGQPTKTQCPTCGEAQRHQIF